MDKFAEMVRNGIEQLSTSVAPSVPHKIESMEESHFVSQVMAYLPPNLPDDGGQPFVRRTLSEIGGALDDLLLTPKSTRTLCSRLAQAFADDEHSLAGLPEHVERRGRYCRLGSYYASKVFSARAVLQALGWHRGFWNAEYRGNIERLKVDSGTRLIIVGDTHGQFDDVLWLFVKYGMPSRTNRYLFNGDIVDRGGHALEIILVLFAFKRDEPESVYILRGNHEDPAVFMNHGFSFELEHKFPEEWSIIEEVLKDSVFPMIPLAAIVESKVGRAAVLHGGVPLWRSTGDSRKHGPISLEDDICRFVDRFARKTVQGAIANPSDTWGNILFQLFWNDPVESDGEIHPYSTVNNGRGKRGAGARTAFLRRDTEEFCLRNRVDCVIRSHEPSVGDKGCHLHHSGLCLTVFSASNYGGTGSACRNGGKAGVVIIKPETSELKDHMAPGFNHLAMIVPRYLGASVSERQAITRAYEQHVGVVDVDDGEPGAVMEPPSPDDPVAEEPGLGPPPSRREEERPATGPPPQLARHKSSTPVGQVAEYLAGEIVRHKEKLFDAFSARSAGDVSKEVWAETLSSVLTDGGAGLVQEMSNDLFDYWCLQEPVGFVRFLNRFQVTGNFDRPDLLRVASTVRRKLSSMSECDVSSLLNQDERGDVSLLAFQDLIQTLRPTVGIDERPWQLATLYETLVANKMTKDNRDTLSFDDAIVGVSVMSRDPRPEDHYSKMSQEIGQMMVNIGKSPACFFREWDGNRNGFLEPEEISRGLKQFVKGITEEHISGFETHCELQGVSDNGTVSLLAFCRALAPQSLTAAIHRALTSETLKHVWLQEKLLRSMLRNIDKGATGKVTVDEFRQCLDQMVAHLDLGLSEYQMGAICELASQGGRRIKYEQFLQGLRCSDTCVFTL